MNFPKAAPTLATATPAEGAHADRTLLDVDADQGPTTVFDRDAVAAAAAESAKPTSEPALAAASAKALPIAEIVEVAPRSPDVTAPFQRMTGAAAIVVASRAVPAAPGGPGNTEIFRAVPRAIVVQRPAGAMAPQPSSTSASRTLAGMAFFVLASLGVLGLSAKYVPSGASAGALPPAAFVAAPARVVVSPAEMLPPGRSLSLIGEVRPLKQIALYSKVSGYLKDVRFDKGDKVTAGQVLGVLENPDADGRIASAQADYGLKTSVAKRAKALNASGSTSVAESERAEAEVAIANAELSRAMVNKGYGIMRAPFAGVITARYADPGALLQAATSSAPGALPLAELSDVSSVRITVFVGQADAPFVGDGTPVKIWSDAKPTEKVAATITRTTHALDARTRTMQCEIQLENPNDRFTAGGSVHVDLVAASPSALAVPAEGVFLRQGKPTVVVVRDGKAVVTPVETGDHDGKRVRILSGIAEGDLVALNAGHELANGARVEAVRKDAAGPKMAGK